MDVEAHRYSQYRKVLSHFWKYIFIFPHPMAELVLDRCVFVESSCHGQGHLETLISLYEKNAITIYKSIGIKRLKLIDICVLVVNNNLLLISQEIMMTSKAIHLPQLVGQVGH